MAARRYKNAAVCPEEVVYEPKSLCVLAARVVSTSLDVSARAVPAELLEVLGAQGGDSEWLPFELKERTCESLQGKLKFGEFALFPDCDSRPTPRMFGVELRVAATHVLRFLQCARATGAIWQKKALEVACTQRYRVFIEQQAKMPKQRLLPPLDVAVVHLSHMLQSEDYHNFARTFGVGLEWLPHCCTWVYAGDDTMRVARDETIKASPVLERLYGAYDGWAVNTSFMGKITAVVKAALPAYKRVDADDDDRSGPACGIAAADPRVQAGGYSYSPTEPARLDSVHMSARAAIDCVAAFVHLPQCVIDDSDWFDNFIASQNGRHSGFSAEELDHFLLAYQRYLFLLAKYEHKMEWIGFAPTPAVDLMWHTHLLHPRHYWYDVGFLFGGGKPPQHKLLPVEARQQFVYEKHASAEAALWEEEFHEPLAPNVKSVLSAPKPTLQRPPLH